MVNRSLNQKPFDRRARPADALIRDWQSPDGWVHRRLDWPQPDGKAVRGTLLFASGRGDFIEKYLEAAAHWHARGWAVTMFDWRGQGGSRGHNTTGHLDSFEPLVDDLAALVAELKQGPGPHVAIAHSMGGHVLLRALAEKRVAPDAAVLIAPMLGINSGPLPPWAAAWTAAAMASGWWRRTPVWGKAPRAARQKALTSSSQRYSDELWWWKKEPGFRLVAPSWGWLDAAYRSCARLIDEALRGIETPLLIVATETDRLVSAAAIRRTAAIVPGARLKMFEHAGHEILRESDKLRLEALAEIDAFLDSNAPR